MRTISLAKFEEGIINEDAVIAKENLIAVSDGAGGGGVFADLWSKYLVEHLPEKPIKNYKAFDKWIDGIWEPFYNDCEEKAKAEGGMFLNKFYDEGSFATLVELQHSFTRLADFNNPPYLINCKDPLDENGFRSGKFKIDKDCIVFAASDALAHYILMMYEIAHMDSIGKELDEAIEAQTKNSNYIKSALRLRKLDFAKDVIQKLLNCKYPQQLELHIGRLKRWGFIGHDDYSLAIL